MDLIRSVDELTKTIKEREENRMLRRIGRWLEKFMDVEVTPERSAISHQILERTLMALI